MSSCTYGKIQTNRHTLMKHISFFKNNKVTKESLVAPRPLPKTNQKYYFALVCLMKDSKNYLYFNNLKKYNTLDKNEYEELLNTIEYSWKG